MQDPASLPSLIWISRSTVEKNIGLDAGVAGGPGSTDPCDSANPPDYCSAPNPCKDTKSETLDDETVQKKMNKLWNESYGPENDPLPDDERNEKLTFVIKDGIGYSFEDVTSDNVSSCHISPGNVSVPANAVAILHTHPYKNGDPIKDPRCLAHINYDLQKHGGKYPTYDANSVSKADQSDVATGLTLYVMDKETIHILKKSNPYSYKSTITRCGY